MSVPSDLVLSNLIIRQGEDIVQRQSDLVRRMRRDGHSIVDAEMALKLMDAALVSMRLQHAGAVAAATKPIISGILQ